MIEVKDIPLAAWDAAARVLLDAGSAGDAIAAALNAWPGSVAIDPDIRHGRSIILPLPQKESEV